MTRPRVDLVGRSFGFLTVTSYARRAHRYGALVHLWNVVCRCGNTGVRTTGKLQSNPNTAVPSCGCARYHGSPARKAFIAEQRAAEWERAQRRDHLKRSLPYT